MGHHLLAPGPLHMLLLLPKHPPPTCSAEQSLTDLGKPNSCRSGSSTFYKAFLKSPLSDKHPLACEHFICPYLVTLMMTPEQQVVLSPLYV